MFLSTYLMKVDRKGRVSVPASWRAHLSADGFDGFVALPSLEHPAIDARGLRAFGGLMEKLQADLVARDGTVAAELFSGADNDAGHLAAAALDVPFDGEGRFSLPTRLKAVIGESEQVAFVGRFGFFQIWAAEAWASQEAAESQGFRARVLARRPVRP